MCVLINITKKKTHNIYMYVMCMENFQYAPYTCTSGKDIFIITETHEKTCLQDFLQEISDLGTRGIVLTTCIVYSETKVYCVWVCMYNTICT